jgi:hypothetical protein
MLTYSKLDLEIWYLAVRVLGLILAGTLIVVGIVNQNTEKKKLLRFPELKKYKNPLPTLWVWIALNTIAQLGNVIESLVFTFNTSLGCRFSTNSSTYFSDNSCKLHRNVHDALSHVLYGHHPHTVDLLVSNLQDENSFTPTIRTIGILRL